MRERERGGGGGRRERKKLYCNGWIHVNEFKKKISIKKKRKKEKEKKKEWITPNIKKNKKTKKNPPVLLESQMYHFCPCFQFVLRLVWCCFF